MKTAQDDIHLGLCHEMYDDRMNDDEFDIAYEYLENIHGILGISCDEQHEQQDIQQSSNSSPIQHQQQLYTDAYTKMMEQQSNS